jgi:hypothetical protein
MNQVLIFIASALIIIAFIIFYICSTSLADFDEQPFVLSHLPPHLREQETTVHANRMRDREANKDQVVNNAELTRTIAPLIFTSEKQFGYPYISMPTLSPVDTFSRAPFIYAGCYHQDEFVNAPNVTQYELVMIYDHHYNHPRLCINLASGRSQYVAIALRKGSECW